MSSDRVARFVPNLARAEARTATVSAWTVLFVPDPLEVLITESEYADKRGKILAELRPPCARGGGFAIIQTSSRKVQPKRNGAPA